MADILEEIVAYKRKEIEQHKAAVKPSALYRIVEEIMDEGKPQPSMRASLLSSESGIIAEFKRRSPSKGWIKEDADAAVKAVFDTIADALAENDKVQLIGFGTFDVAERAAREGRNPRTGATMNIEASKAPRFKAGKALKDKING